MVYPPPPVLPVPPPRVTDAQLLGQAVKRANAERKRARAETEDSQRAAKRLERVARIVRLGKAKAHAVRSVNATEPEPSANVAEGAANVSHVPDREDRAINTAEFELLQELCGQQFTLDACMCQPHRG